MPLRMASSPLLGTNAESADVRSNPLTVTRTPPKAGFFVPDRSGLSAGSRLQPDQNGDRFGGTSPLGGA